MTEATGYPSIDVGKRPAETYKGFVVPAYHRVTKMRRCRSLGTFRAAWYMADPEAETLAAWRRRVDSEYDYTSRDHYRAVAQDDLPDTCLRCGALVADRYTHDTWHASDA